MIFFDPAFIFTLIFLGVVLAVLFTFALGGILAAPWVPLWKKDIHRMMRLAEVRENELLYDLGAGDGRIILIAGKDYKARAIGFEIAILPYLLGYIKIIMHRVADKVWLKYNNFYGQDLGKADVICAFLTPEAMRKLKPKFEKECKSGCRIVSFAFKVPGWEPAKIDKPSQNKTAIYLYRR